jgi:chromate transporter
MKSPLASLATVFSQLSLVAVGGANTIIPDIQHHFVDTGAMDSTTFASLVALAQAAPGPNAMVVGLVGWHVAGALGALVATLSFCGPPAILTLLLGRAWGRVRETGIGEVVLRGVAPLTVGLILASAWSLTRAQGLEPLTLAITVSVALGTLFRSTAAMWLLALAAVVEVVAA